MFRRIASAFWGSRKRTFEGEMDAEIAFHIEARASELARRGFPPEDAARRARVEFGGVEKYREACRESRGAAHWLDSLAQDVRTGARSLRKDRSFTVLAVLTIALGVGATTTIFSAVETVVFRPLPYKDSRSLTTIYSMYPRYGPFPVGVSLRDWLELSSNSRSFEESAFFHPETMTLTGGSEPEAVGTKQVSRDFFDLLGAQPVAGRFFTGSEQAEGDHHVAVLSDELWLGQFGGQKQIIGCGIHLNGQDFTVVGIAPAGFDVPGAGGEYRTGVWLPLQPLRPGVSNAHFKGSLAGSVIARLRRNVGMREANAELNAVGALLQRKYPNNDREWSLRAMTLQQEVVGQAQRYLVMLAAAAILVLLIACANTGGLVLSRGLRRQGEFTIRRALGAQRGRIVQQLLVEHSVLALSASLLGAGLAIEGIALFRRFAPAFTPRLAEIRPDLHILWFGLAGAGVVSILLGFAPMVQPASSGIGRALKERAARTVSSASRARSAVIVAEVALSLALTIGSILLVESYLRFVNTPPGMNINHVVSVRMDLEQSRYPDAEHVENFVQQVMERMHGSPYIENIAASDSAWLGGDAFVASHIEVDGNPGTAGGVGDIEMSEVSPAFFRTFQIPLIAGREFTNQDAADDSQVAIVNRTMAAMFWPNRSPIGGRVSFDRDAEGRPIWLSVIGVAGDTRDDSLALPPKPELYTALFQHRLAAAVSIFVRTSAPVAAVAPAIKQWIWAVDREQPISQIQELHDIVAQQAAPARFQGFLLGTFASLGLFFAAIGVYGAVSDFVDEHTREFGIRVAVGAPQFAILGLVLKRGMSLVLSGIALGMLMALGLLRLASSQFFGVTPTDPRSYSLGIAMLTVVGLAACVAPVRRALGVDPWIALREE
jgi:putative ABC transport system permease protein